MEEYYTRISMEHLLSCFDEEFIRLTDSEAADFLRLYGRLKGEYRSDAPFFFTLAELLRFLGEAVDRQEKEPLRHRISLSKGSHRIKTIISYITAQYNNITSIDEIAAYYLNKSYMYRLFKKETGMTVFEYLNHVKIQRACEMLRTSGDSLTGIAINCGFSTASYFSYAFKEIMTCTPSQFRRRQLEN